jgi:hypothetical protein
LNNTEYGTVTFESETLEYQTIGDNNYIQHLHKDEQIIVSADPAAGYEFEGWYLEIDMETHAEYQLLSTDEIYTFDITGDMKIQARFKEASNG